MSPPDAVGPLPVGDAATWSGPLDAAVLADHVDYCRNGPDAEKGKALEELATWLLAQIDGFSVEQRNTWALGGASEVDLSIFNRGHQNGFASLPDQILVECKNRTSTIDSSEVAWFDWKLQLGGARMGMIFTRTKVTGDPVRRTAAWSIITKANGATPQRRILVILLDEVEALTSIADLKALIITKLTSLPLGTPQL